MKIGVDVEFVYTNKIIIKSKETRKLCIMNIQVQVTYTYTALFAKCRSIFLKLQCIESGIVMRLGWYSKILSSFC